MKRALLFLGLWPALALAQVNTGGNTVSASFISPLNSYVVAIKSVPLLTSGSPADIAGPIAIPAGVTRWRIGVPSANGIIVLAESAAGTAVATTIGVYDTAGGSGPASLINNGTQTLSTLSASGTISAIISGGNTTSAGYSTGKQFYIRQTVNSANACTASFYVWIYPMNP